MTKTDSESSNSPNRGININGVLLVILLIIIVAIAVIALISLRPQPMSPVDVARLKQLEVFNDENAYSAQELSKLSKEDLDRYIGTLNYIIRIDDSLELLISEIAPGAESMMIDPRLDPNFAGGNLIKRRAAAVARAMQVMDSVHFWFADSLHKAVHEPDLEVKHDSLNSTFQPKPTDSNLDEN